MFGEIFILEACMYNFLTLEGFVFFLITVLTFLVKDSTAKKAVEGEATTKSRTGVTTGGVVFSYGFIVFEVVNFTLLMSLVMSKKCMTHLLIVSFFS